MSTKAIPVRVALIDQTGTIARSALDEVAGALSEQVAHDFAPVWHVNATVGVYTEQQPGMWTILIQRTLDDPNALGYHTDDHNQPISYVELTRDWPATVSHELLEMLADPWGSRMHGARLPWGVEDQYERFGLAHESTHVSYLLEVCDPPEATSYEVGGVELSDFVHPHWYRTNAPPGYDFSQAGGCKIQREVAEGGYVSFCNPKTGEWYQIFNHRGQLQISDLGKFDKTADAVLRQFTDRKAREFRGRDT